VPLDAPGSTAIVVLTREAEPVIGGLYRRQTGAGQDGMKPHVTLTVPFVPAAEIDASVGGQLALLADRGRHSPSDR
jgi:hypothetical protein